ncbi:predicted protein [Arabidopsis lyrata subsp. lyrata]|uniref:Predicted protein n=1 Tax=Arabidopsis lyrata subsp. lyrata TaxID=81972 RepID=D7LCP7_ARALL|nr:predicted protein [Arabidopsis lyrata subsp. lyrata]
MALGGMSGVHEVHIAVFVVGQKERMLNRNKHIRESHVEKGRGGEVTRLTWKVMDETGISSPENREKGRIKERESREKTREDET